RSRFRPRDEGSSCAASPYAPGSRDLLPSYRRTVPRNSERNNTSASRRRHGRSRTYADATQHHGFIEARCLLRRRSRCYETAGDSFGLATNGHVQVGTTDFSHPASKPDRRVSTLWRLQIVSNRAMDRTVVE